ncbi:hypothetical protein SAMN02800694_2285 [Luteibacter sp. UNCMF331Sha3.1]|uniref:XVIPCD domain-containing protein n=1 Tax=Luteibacter sp. UNCMF331Sha3.1 TaxID=1502760 RepID=UPI0008C85695|nr:XVIPCD domain-containing protein [Luteibacter sp. UNCMF331Sha3.1]SEM95796.1 hypothetical protein SAMN02800694_2285 [Luteibacter sp. UNCMF331Sha3.1]
MKEDHDNPSIRHEADLVSKLLARETKLPPDAKGRRARARLTNEPPRDDSAERNTINAIEHAIDQIEAGRRRRHHHCHPHGAAHGLMLDQPEHPHHGLYRQTRDAVHRLDAAHGRTPDERSDNLAGALTVSAHRDGMDRVDHVALSDDASQAFAIKGDVASPHKQVVEVATSEAVATPLADSSAALAAAAKAPEPQDKSPEPPLPHPTLNL